MKILINCREIFRVLLKLFEIEFDKFGNENFIITGGSPDVLVRDPCKYYSSY